MKYQIWGPYKQQLDMCFMYITDVYICDKYNKIVYVNNFP